MYYNEKETLKNADTHNNTVKQLITSIERMPASHPNADQAIVK